MRRQNSVSRKNEPLLRKLFLKRWESNGGSLSRVKAPLPTEPAVAARKRRPDVARVACVTRAVSLF